MPLRASRSKDTHVHCSGIYLSSMWKQSFEGKETLSKITINTWTIFTIFFPTPHLQNLEQPLKSREFWKKRTIWLFYKPPQPTPWRKQHHQHHPPCENVAGFDKGVATIPKRRQDVPATCVTTPEGLGKPCMVMVQIMEISSWYHGKIGAIILYFPKM